MATPSIQIRPGNPDFLDRDWSRPIEEWDDERVVEMPTGIHRHPVVFVAYEEGIYAVKELSRSLAEHEFVTLRRLEERTTRTARAAGLVERGWLDVHAEGAGVVITRYIAHAFPYRELVSGSGFGPRRKHMLDAFAGLLVELHLSGCYWGDCSLSNVLYRYDAATIEAVMVDAETARVYDSLSTGQRRQDLEIMEMNVAGEMADIAASQGYDLDQADLGLGSDITDRYWSLWAELTTELIIGPEERYKIRERIQRLNDLGFSVDEVELEPDSGGDRARIKVAVGGRTYHSDRLRQQIGMDASENQARQILSDLSYHEHKLGGSSPTGKAVAAMRWRSGVFEPLVARIMELLPDDDSLQRYTDFLNHRYLMATAQGRDVDNAEAFQSWVDAGFPGYDPALADGAESTEGGDT